MILFALAAAAAASSHSVTGAFGFTLGQSRPAKMPGACSQFIASTGTEIFTCPARGPFSRIAVTTNHHAVTSVKGSRDYRIAPAAAAMRSCLADLAPYERTVRRQYPGLVQVPIYNGGNFWFSETASGRVPTGRSIIGHCAASQTADGLVTLWLSYDVSTRENVQLINLDKAERR